MLLPSRPVPVQAMEPLKAKALELAHDPVFAALRDARLCYANGAACRLLGYTREEMLTLSIPQLDPNFPMDRWDAHWEELVRIGGQVIESAHRRKDGTLVPVEITITLVDHEGATCLFAYVKDITERRRIQEQLEQAERRLRAILRHSPAVIYQLDPDGRFLLSEGQGLAGIGLQPGQVVGLSALDLYAGDPELVAGLRQALAGQVSRTLSWVEGKAFDNFITPVFDAQGKLECVIGIATDITDRKLAEDAQRQAQKLESLGILAGGIAHDFNNLLTAIMGNLNLAQGQAGEYSSARPYLDKVEHAVLKAADLSRQMLAYSGKGHFVVKPRDLNAIIMEMTGLLAASLSKKIHLELHLAPDLPLFKADGAQIQQVVLNLITNAAEAIGNEEGRIAITTRHALLDREVLGTGFPGQPLEAGNYLSLMVADTGCGMEAAVRPRIFDPFFTTKAAGRGLGLSAMLGILKGHKAGIRIQSEVGQGTTFELFFPALGEGETLEEQQAARKERRLAGTVLLVDDEEIILDSTAPALEAMGFRVVKARDGVQALETFLAMGPELALVLMDLSMPRMDGSTAFLAMRRARPEVPVVLTSGYDRQEATEDLLAQGLAGFVQKPYRIKDLARELGRVLDT